MQCRSDALCWRNDALRDFKFLVVACFVVETPIPSLLSFNPMMQSQHLTEMSNDKLEACHAAFEHRCSLNVAAQGEASRVAVAPGATYFHSSRIPDIALLDIGRFVRKAASDFGVTNDLIASALVLAARFADTTPVLPQMMHRLYIACLFVTLKVSCDYVPRARDVALLTGVNAWELPRLESALLSAIQYRALVVDSDIDALFAKSGSHYAGAHSSIAHQLA